MTNDEHRAEYRRVMKAKAQRERAFRRKRSANRKQVKAIRAKDRGI